MISRITAEKLLAVARRARDQLSFKMDSYLDRTTESRRELAYLRNLVDAAHLEMRDGPDHEFAARQHLQTVQLQAPRAAAYDALELAARVVIRVAGEGDAVELREMIAKMENVVKDQHREQLVARLNIPKECAICGGAKVGAGCPTCTSK